MEEQNKPLSQEDWQDLREQLFALLDITYDYSANVATLEQISVRKQKEESEAQFTKRAHDVYNKRFKEVKANSYDRVVKLVGYVKRLGLPQEMWPKEMEIGSAGHGKG